MKSKIYKDIQSGKCTLQDSYLSGAKFIHKDKKTVEYIHFWNWPDEVKKSHPEFSDYEIRALTFNGQIICSGRVVTYDEKYNGQFRWSCADKKDEELYNKLIK